MINLHRLNGEPFVLNAEWIKTVESFADTRIVLLNGEVYLVRETAGEVTQKALDYQRQVKGHA
jgi:flagellar protein FlbD